jgi:hypothetical protein
MSIRGSKREKVKPAAQILSNTVAKTLEWYGMQSLFKNTTWKETSKFISLIKDWFDIFN